MNKENESMKDIAEKMRQQISGVPSKEEKQHETVTTRPKRSKKTATKPLPKEADTSSHSKPVDTKSVQPEQTSRVSKKGTKSVGALLEYFDSINGTEDFEASGIVYIDPELHAILQSLKQYGGVKIYKLVSDLVKQFVEENKGPIAELIYQRKSKYLT